MRIVVQRVKEASVVVEGEVTGAIEKGLLVFLGIHKDDTPDQTEWLVNKLVNLRLFEDAQGKMNINVKDVGGKVLVVSQFTLYGDCRAGRRPGFGDSASGDTALAIYNKFVTEVEKEMGHVATGIFGAYMEVKLVNDGPVTFIIDGNPNR